MRNLYELLKTLWARIAQSVKQLATACTVRGSNPGGIRFSAPDHTGYGDHPASYTMSTWSLSWDSLCLLYNEYVVSFLGLTLPPIQ